MLAGRGQRLQSCHQLGRRPGPVRPRRPRHRGAAARPAAAAQSGSIGREHLMGGRQPCRQRRETLGALARRQDGAVAGGDPGGQPGARAALLVQELRPAEPLPERQLQGVPEDQRGARSDRARLSGWRTIRSPRATQNGRSRAGSSAKRTPAQSGRSSGRAVVSLIARRRWSAVPFSTGSRRGGAEQLAGPGTRVGRPRLPQRALAGPGHHAALTPARAQLREAPLAELDHRLEQAVEVGLGGPVVGEVDPDREALGQARGRGRGDAAFLQVGHDLGVQAIGLGGRESAAPDAEADDVERDRRHQLEALLLEHQGRQIARPGGSWHRSPRRGGGCRAP